MVTALQAKLASREELIRELEEKLKEQSQSLHRQDVALSDNSVTVAPCLSSSDTASTPPMEDALDVSLVVGRFEALRNSDSQVEQLQQSLEQVNVDLAKAKIDLVENEKLKQDLERANVDLAKARDNLLHSELALSEKEEENKKTLLDKDIVIQDLKAKADNANAELLKSSASASEQTKQINSLQEKICVFETKSKDLTKEVTLSKESLRQVKGKLLTVRDSLIQGLSPLRQDLVELR